MYRILLRGETRGATFAALRCAPPYAPCQYNIDRQALITPKKRPCFFGAAASVPPLNYRRAFIPSCDCGGFCLLVMPPLSAEQSRRIL
jgi:hypothetical protein